MHRVLAAADMALLHITGNLLHIAVHHTGIGTHLHQDGPLGIPAGLRLLRRHQPLPACLTQALYP